MKKMARKVVMVSRLEVLLFIKVMAPPVSASGSGHSFSSVSTPSAFFTRSMWDLELSVKDCLKQSVTYRYRDLFIFLVVSEPVSKI